MAHIGGSIQLLPASKTSYLAAIKMEFQNLQLVEEENVATGGVSPQDTFP